MQLYIQFLDFLTHAIGEHTVSDALGGTICTAGNIEAAGAVPVIRLCL